MEVTFDINDNVNGLLTVVMTEDDLTADIDKELKKERQRATMPGFRRGTVPMALIKKQVGRVVRMDVVNKKLSDTINNYITENKVQMLGRPLASESQEPVDLEKPAPYTFKFDIAIAPKIDVTIGADDTIDYYDIQVDDELIDRQVNAFASRFGNYKDAETYTAGDSIRGDLRELGADGNALEGGITVEGALIMPSFIKDEEQKKLFDGTKPGDVITFNPRKAYPYPDGDSELSALLRIGKDDLGNHAGDFTFQVTTINHYEPHAIDQELFDDVYGKDKVKDEKDFRQHIAEGLKQQLKENEDFKFQQDLRAYAEKKVGDVQLPDALLKRLVRENTEDTTKSPEDFDKEYDASRRELVWSLIRDHLAVAEGVKVTQDDVRQEARKMALAQFQQYGMANIGEEYVSNYVDRLLEKRENVQMFSERAVDDKLAKALQAKVKLNTKTISLDDFNKMME